MLPLLRLNCVFTKHINHRLGFDSKLSCVTGSVFNSNIAPIKGFCVCECVCVSVYVHVKVCFVYFKWLKTP